MNWLEITVHTTSEATELVASVFDDYPGGNGGVAICDRKDILDLVRNGKVWDYLDDALYRETADSVALVKGFVPETDGTEGVRRVRERLDEMKKLSPFEMGTLEITTRLVDDEDWFNIWKQHYRTIRIGKVAIVPVWEEPPAEGAVVRIDPGMAFGTGEHETTSLCIEMMQHAEVSGRDVIDVGCGSGILGIAACKLGAKSAYLCDIDPVAVRAAGENAGLNGCGDELRIECRDLLKDKEITADVILINIVADVLIGFAPEIGTHLRPGGELILSGIIHSRLEDVRRAYEAEGFVLREALSKGEWDCLLWNR